MTLTEALTKVDQQMDDIADRILSDAENFILDLGATDSECEAWLARTRQELSKTRRQVREMVSASFWTGLDAPSARVH